MKMNKPKSFIVLYGGKLIRAYHENEIDDLIDKKDAEIRKLNRVLWLTRANDASSFASLFSTLSDIDDDEYRTYWIFGNKRKIVIDGLKCHRMETAYKWFCIWLNVADKCLKKAEEYK